MCNGYLGLGISIASSLGHHYESSLIAFLLCSCIGLLSLRGSLSSVRIHSLSPAKLMYIYGSYRKDLLLQKEDLTVLTPSQVADAEADSMIFQLSADQLMRDIICHEGCSRFAGSLDGNKIKSFCPLTIGSDVSSVFPDTYGNVMVSWIMQLKYAVQY